MPSPRECEDCKQAATHKCWYGKKGEEQEAYFCSVCALSCCEEIRND